MKVLWVTNIPLPEASELMKEKVNPFGGWLVNTSYYLAERNDIELSIAFPKKNITSIHIIRGEKINYYLFPQVKETDLPSIINNINLNEVLIEYDPDIVHLFGTEYAHTLAMVNICKNRNINVVISIQGLVSVYARHYMANLPIKIQYGFSLRDFIKQENLYERQRNFTYRGRLEIESIKKTNHVIGRTTWDRACTFQINPSVQYHHCNEILREEFYNYQWDIKNCEEFSIFVSQGSYPIKGLHFVLEALPLILMKFPGTKLYIGGSNIIKSETLVEKLKMTSYGKYIKYLVKVNRLQNNIIFTENLNEVQMCERYLKSNVFVCASSIENSPNSLGEAMILGVPCIASDVGGITDMLTHKEEGFVYQGDAPYMLAHYVCEIFENKKLAIHFSKQARIRALLTHDRVVNTDTLLNIYVDIFQSRDL